MSITKAATKLNMPTTSHGLLMVWSAFVYSIGCSFTGLCYTQLIINTSVISIRLRHFGVC